MFLLSVTSLPYPMKWELNDQIVPPEEDYFDYKIHEAVFCRLTWVILTKENVSSFEFNELKVKSSSFFLVECHRCIVRMGHMSSVFFSTPA